MDLEEILEAGWRVEFNCVGKRMEIVGVGDFYVRHVWKADRGDKKLECGWEGFKTAKECLRDLSDKLRFADEPGVADA